jgi:tetratricopeptide (TPR) repeat protein
VAVALGLAPLTITSSARADEPTAAQLSDQAFARYEAGDFPGAVAFYMKAYALNVDPRVLFNVAQIYDKKVQDRDLALEYYRRYLKSTTTEVDLVRKATERVTELQRQQDERAKPAAPAQPATPPVAPPQVTPPALVPAPIAPPPGGEAESSPRTWIGYTTAGVLGIGAAVTGSLALSSSSTLAKTSFTGPTAPADLTSKSSSTRTLAITTDVLLGSAVVAAAVTLIVQLTATKGPRATGTAHNAGLSGTDLVWRF